MACNAAMMMLDRVAPALLADTYALDSDRIRTLDVNGFISQGASSDNRRIDPCKQTVIHRVGVFAIRIPTGWPAGQK